MRISVHTKKKYFKQSKNMLEFEQFVFLTKCIIAHSQTKRMLWLDGRILVKWGKIETTYNTSYGCFFPFPRNDKKKITISLCVGVGFVWFRLTLYETKWFICFFNCSCCNKKPKHSQVNNFNCSPKVKMTHKQCAHGTMKCI